VQASQFVKSDKSTVNVGGVSQQAPSQSVQGTGSSQQQASSVAWLASNGTVSPLFFSTFVPSHHILGTGI